MPIQPFRDLLSAFKQDVTKRRYANFDEVLDYCARSANPVGRLILLLFDYREEGLHKLSDSICTGLQLANFWQDVRTGSINSTVRNLMQQSITSSKFLQRIFSVAVDFEVLGKNPAAKVSMLKETPRDRIMTYEEEARIAPRLNLPTRRMLRLAVVIALNA